MENLWILHRSYWVEITNQQCRQLQILRKHLSLRSFYVEPMSCVMSLIHKRILALIPEPKTMVTKNQRLHAQHWVVVSVIGQTLFQFNKKKVN